MKKLSFIGTSCSGKTTAALALGHALKTEGVLCEVSPSSDRQHFIHSEDLMRSEDAQCFMVLQQALAESHWGTRGHVDLLVSDRSVIDLLAYYLASFAGSSKRVSIEVFAETWAKTYDCLIYLPPLPYQADGKRPSDEFRLKVDTLIRRLVDRMPVLGLEHRYTDQEILDAAHRTLS